MQPPAVVFPLVISLTLFSVSANAAEYSLIPYDPPGPSFAAGAIRRSAAVVDDATLYDVAVVGNRCWAVGERGVILRSDDSGMTWVSGILPFNCSLNSVCFLTNRIGFVAGFRPDLHAKADRGVLLATRDGGQNWYDLESVTSLPGLRFVKFFGLEHGVAVTTGALGQNGKVLVTKDSGQTWNQVQSKDPPADWVNAAFIRPDEGLVVGRRQTYGLVNGNKLVLLGHPGQTLQRVNAASLSDDGQAWLVGDGGFIRRSTNRGVVWKPPAGRLPTEIRDIFRLTSIVHDGARVCVAGTPACSVLCSYDAGATWTIVSCAGGGAIHRLVRIGSHSVLAVGSWGMIMRSADFGRSWTSVRHGRRRSALMYVVTDPEDASPLMLASIAGDQGYRVSVVQPSQQLHHPRMSQHWQAVLAGTGVNTLTTDWRFTRTRMRHRMSQRALLETWDAASDGQLRELLPLRLAAQIRTWRPDVICIESSSDNDAVAQVWRMAMKTASRIADGSSLRSVPLDKAGLQPWSVQRVICRTHTESAALEFRADTLLPRLRTTAGLVATTVSFSGTSYLSQPDDAATYLIEPDSAAVTPAHMFRNISLLPGSDGRRELNRLDSGIEHLQSVVTRHHTQKMAITGQVRRSPMGEGLIAYTQTIGSNLPTSMAAAQLQHLLELFRSRDNLEGCIAVQQEFTRRLPRSPQAAHAAAELHLLYSSAEISLLRKRGLANKFGAQLDTVVRIPNGSQPAAALEQERGSPVPAITVKPWILPAAGTSLDVLQPSRGSEEKAVEQHWNQQAGVSWRILNQLAPDLAKTAQQQLIVAARHRRMQQLGQERAILTAASNAADSHSMIAINELQSVFSDFESVLPAFNLPESRRRPQLDGVLGDLCWQHAPEIRLTASQPGNRVADSLVMLSWDAEFLFVAGHIPVAGNILPESEVFNRSHDEADTKSDYIQLQLDVDRDYSTGWHFVVDSAGRTRDRCWQFTRWNPEWYVATQRDENGWRFEAAIPVRELRETHLAAGVKWAINIRRIVPGYVDQRVDVSESVAEIPTRYCLIRFIRNRHKQ